MSKIEEIKAIENRIKDALRLAETYAPILDFLIEDVAQIRYLKDVTIQQINGPDDVVQEVVTREKNIKTVINPAIGLLFELTESSRKMLSDLGMTAKTVSVSEGDELDRLNRKYEEALKP